jgi:proteic killer suppression protein
MIESFKHRGMRRYFEDDDRKLLRQDLVERIAVLLGNLDDAKAIEELDIPSLRLHPFEGDRKGFWSITVRASWRIIFPFECDAAKDVELVDCH